MNAQDDFGSLEIPDDAEHGVFLLHVMNHPVLSRENSVKAQKDSEFLITGCRGRRKTDLVDDALVEMFDSDLLFEAARAVLSITRSSTVQVEGAAKALENETEPIRKTTDPVLLRPPRRFPRRIWIGFVKRILHLQCNDPTSVRLAMS